MRTGTYAAYPGATVLHSVDQLLRQSVDKAAPRERGSVASTLGAVGVAITVRAARAAIRNVASGLWGAKYHAIVERWSAALQWLGPLYASAPRLRRIALSGDGAVQQLHRSLSRAIARHGCFGDLAAVTSFLVKALTRAERDLVVLDTGLESCAEHRAANPSSRTRIEALGF